MGELGMVTAAVLAAAALLAPSARGRAMAMLGALVLTLVLLGSEIRDAPQVQALVDRPAPAAAAAAAGLVVVGALAVLFARRPALLAAFVVVALPFRLPVELAGAVTDLLVPLHLVTAAAALAWLVPRLRAGPAHDPPLAGGWLERLLAGAVVLYALQAAYSSDGSEALRNVAFFHMPLLLLFALLRELDWTPRLTLVCAGALIGLALVLTAVGFFEFSERTLLLNPKAVAANQVSESFRIGSLFFDPDLYGRFLAVAMLGLAALLLWRREPRAVLAAAGGLGVLWAGLLLTLSRPSFAALLSGLVALAALRWAPWRALAATAVAVAVAVGLVLAFPATLRLDLSPGETVGAAASGRLELVRGGVELARRRPVFGHGSGSFASEYRRSQGASGERAVAASRTLPITVAAEQGAIGLAVHLALLVAALGRLLPGAARSAARAAVAAGFVGLVVHTWLYAAYLEDPLTWTLLGAGVALARAPGGAAREETPEPAAEPPVAV